MRHDVAVAWLAYLRERQPHKRIELSHLAQQMRPFAPTKQYDDAVRRLRTLAYQYPNDWTVFQTQQRLLGVFTAEDFT